MQCSVAASHFCRLNIHRKPHTSKLDLDLLTMGASSPQKANGKPLLLKFQTASVHPPLHHLLPEHFFLHCASTGLVCHSLELAFRNGGVARIRLESDVHTCASLLLGALLNCTADQAAASHGSCTRTLPICCLDF